jgi:hypothetical protein
MITRVDYAIRFPFGAEFNKNPKFHFIQSIYRDIKTHACLGDTQCESCFFTDSCVYFYISGQEFTQYPAILVNMNCLEKTKYKRNDVLDISFFLIGDASLYIEFIDGFFKSCNNLFGVYFQKTRKGEIKYDEKNLYEGKLTVITPFNINENINEMLEYYNIQYKADFSPNLEINELETIRSNDRRVYLINGKRFKLSGHIGSFHVRNYPLVLLDMGIGRNNVLGGGRAIRCE